MSKAALGRGDCIPFDLTRRASDRTAVELHDARVAGGDFGQLAVFEHDRAARVLENRGNVRRDEVLAVAKTQHQRRRGFSGDQLVGLSLRQHDDREGSAEAQDGLAHSLGQAAAGFQLLFDQMRDELGIRFGSQLMAAREQLRAQVDKVLNDAIVNYRNRARFVRMRILFGRAAVRRPSRVPDSDVALQRRVGQQVAKIFEFALGAANLELATVDDGRDSGRVVATILETGQSSEQNWVSLARSHVSDYSAHNCSLLSPAFAGKVTELSEPARTER